jgi:hypothetical protein
LITVEIVFIIETSTTNRRTEEKFAIHEIQQLFFPFFLRSVKFHFHYWRKKTTAERKVKDI